MQSMPRIAVADVPKKSILKYLVPAAAIVVVVLLFVIFNPFNFQISTQKGTAAPEKGSLAVMYFENIPDPEDKDHTGEMLTNLLTTSLFQTKDIEVISRERLYDIQKELGQAEGRSITPSMATKVADRAGVSMMLLGSILQQQPSLAITYRLIEVHSGKIVSTQRLSGYPAEKVFALVDTLALLVKNDLNLSTVSSGETKSVASVTTSSPEAYRSYLEGVELNNKFYGPEARAAYERAIELDSNFAMAYFGLATLSLSNDDNLRASALKKAYSLRNNVTEKERLSIQAQYTATIENNVSKAATFLESRIQKYPHEQGAYVGLGMLYGNLGESDKSIQTFLKGLQSDSLDKNLWNVLAYEYMHSNRRKEALTAIDRYLQLAPAEPNPYDSKGDIYAAFDDRDSATIWWQRALNFRSDFPSSFKLANVALVRQEYATAEKYYRQDASSKQAEEKLYNEFAPLYIFEQRGQLKQGRNRLANFFAQLEPQNNRGWLTGTLNNLAMLAYEQNDFSGMLDYMQHCSQEAKKNPDDKYYERQMLALAYMKNGNRSMASKILNEVRDDFRDDIPGQQAKVNYAEALFSFEEGKYDKALEGFNKAMQGFSKNHAPLYFYALCLLKAGHQLKAMNELQRMTVWTPIDHSQTDLDNLPFFPYWRIASVKAHYWLGVVYEQQGKKDQAIKEYEKFLEIWKDADFKSVELQDAKVRLEKLRGMASR
jgi:TolB-like protein/Flp pilus assembly protein TadD